MYALGRWYAKHRLLGRVQLRRACNGSKSTLIALFSVLHMPKKRLSSLAVVPSLLLQGIYYADKSPPPTKAPTCFSGCQIKTSRLTHPRTLARIEQILLAQHTLARARARAASPHARRAHRCPLRRSYRNNPRARGEATRAEFLRAGAENDESPTNRTQACPHERRSRRDQRRRFICYKRRQRRRFSCRKSC